MAEVTAMRNNALPYPVYGVSWTVVAPLLDADGDPVSPSSPDSEVSKNGDTFADCTNEATEIATSSGVVYLTLTAAEMTADIVTVRIQSTGAKTTILTLYPRKLPILSTGTCQGSNDTGDIQLASGDSAVDDTYNGCLCVAVIDGTTEARIINDYVGSTKVAEVSPAWNTAQPDSNDTYTIYLPEGRQVATVNSTYFASTSQTARDIGASVLLSNGTGTGQVKLASGYVAMTWADIGSPTTTVNLSGTTVKTATDVETDTADIQSRLPAALVNSRMDCTIDGTGMESGAVDNILNRDASGSTTNSTLGAIINDWENGGRLDLIVDDILTDTGTTLQGELDGIQADTEDIQTRLPAALVNSRMDCTIDAAGMESGAVANIHAGLTLVSNGTIGATGNSTTAVHLSGLTYGDDELNDYLLVILDVSASEYHARWIEDWADTGDLATVATLPFTPENSVDKYWILPIRQDVSGGSGLDAAGVRAAIGMSSANLDTQLGAIDDYLDTEVAAIKTKTDYLPSATAGASGGLLIAGSNAATTFATLTVTGAFTVSGGVAFNNSSGTAFSIYTASGNAVYIQSDTATAMVIETVADTNTIELVRDDDSTGNILGNITGNLSGSAGSVTGAVGSVTGNVGGNVVGSVASVTGAVGSVTGNVGGNVVGSVASVTTVNDKTGYSLSSSGLDSVSTTAPSGVASNFREMLVQTWRRFFKKTTRDSDEIKTYADNGSTVVTTQTYTASGSDETVNAAS